MPALVVFSTSICVDAEVVFRSTIRILISIDRSTPYVKSVVRTNATVRVPPTLNSAPVGRESRTYPMIELVLTGMKVNI